MGTTCSCCIRVNTAPTNPEDAFSSLHKNNHIESGEMNKSSGNLSYFDRLP